MPRPHRQAEVLVRAEAMALEGKHARQHEVQTEAGSPDVARGGVGLAQQDLRRQIVRRARHGQRAVEEAPGRVEVDELEIRQAPVDEHVHGLDVPVDDALVVQVRHGLEQGSGEPPRLGLVQAPGARVQDRGLEAQAVEEVEDQHCAPREGEEVQRADDVGVLHGRQELELLPGRAEQLLVVDAEDLQGHLLPARELPGAVDHGARALAEAFQHLEAV
mmetsp:Transcript_107804/g.336201  ORF Transcript_107804/g.336201 Transcript_107804/m.336201 type:complete len:218 (-) Transcript_107804:314-967(-)